MNWFFWAACCPTFFIALAVHAQDQGSTDVHIDTAYDAALVANTFLMQNGGVDTLTLKDGAEVLVGVAQVGLRPGATAADIHKAKKIAASRATATVGEFLRSEVTSVSTLIKKSTTHSEEADGHLQQRTRRVEKFLSTRIQTASHFSGKIEPIGQWRSVDKHTVYVAVAVVPIK